MYVITYEKHFENEETPRSFVFGYYSTENDAVHKLKLLRQKSILAPLKYGTNYQYHKVELENSLLSDDTILYVRCVFHHSYPLYYATVYTNDTTEYPLDYPRKGLVGGSFCDFVVLFSVPLLEIKHFTRSGLLHSLARRAQIILEKTLDIKITVTEVRKDPLIKRPNPLLTSNGR